MRKSSQAACTSVCCFSYTGTQKYFLHKKALQATLFALHISKKHKTLCDSHFCANFAP